MRFAEPVVNFSGELPSLASTTLQPAVPRPVIDGLPCRKSRGPPPNFQMDKPQDGGPIPPKGPGGYSYGEHGELPAPLFSMLDAAYPVAVLVDRLVDTLVAEDRLKLDKRWTTPALKYWVSALISAATGGRHDTVKSAGCAPPPGAPVLELDTRAWYVFADTAEQVCRDCGVQGLLFKKFLEAIEGAMRGPRFLTKSHSVPSLSCLQPPATDTDGTPEPVVAENCTNSTHDGDAHFTEASTTEVREVLEGTESGSPRSASLRSGTSTTAGSLPRARGRSRGGRGRVLGGGSSAPDMPDTFPQNSVTLERQMDRYGVEEVDTSPEMPLPTAAPCALGNIEVVPSALDLYQLREMQFQAPAVPKNIQEDMGSRQSSASGSSVRSKARRWGTRRA